MASIMDLRKICLLTAMAILLLCFNRCFHDQTATDPRGEAYAGSAECLRCHGTISASYAHTAHFLSTRIADEHTVNGRFSNDSNTLLVDDTSMIRMEKRDSGLYQVLYIKNKQTDARRFDLVMGSIKGQTYIYRKDSGFFQMPVSYFTALHQWTTSPGYSFRHINFERPVSPECFGCHSSFVNQSNAVLNIDCERCHGPAAAHVQFHEAHPEEKEARFMVSFQGLSRTQKIDLCAVCHSGTKHILLKSTFGFKMGDTLSAFMIPLFTGNELDVHGNQTQLLSQSKCFRMSSMTCATCHNTHVNQRGMVKSFNDDCQHCHTPGHVFCTFATPINTAFLRMNCTNCHMPAQPSKSIIVQTASNTAGVSSLVVNHRIAIYPEETKKILKTIPR
jgi:hypothetical protein